MRSMHARIGRYGSFAHYLGRVSSQSFKKRWSVDFHLHLESPLRCSRMASSTYESFKFLGIFNILFGRKVRKFYLLVCETYCEFRPLPYLSKSRGDSVSCSMGDV